MGQLASIGIVKGKKFDPDARMKTILTEAAAVGMTVSRTLSYKPREPEGFAYYPGSAWLNYLWVGRVQHGDALHRWSRPRVWCHSRQPARRP